MRFGAARDRPAGSENSPLAGFELCTRRIRSPTHNLGSDALSIVSYGGVLFLHYRRPIGRHNEQIQRIGSSQRPFDPLLRPEAKSIETFAIRLLFQCHPASKDCRGLRHAHAHLRPDLPGPSLRPAISKYTRSPARPTKCHSTSSTPKIPQTVMFPPRSPS